MNLALPAVVLTALLLPGFLLWYGYRFVEKANAGQDSSGPTFRQLAGTMVISALLHFCWVPFCESISAGPRFSSDSVLMLLAASYGPDDSRFHEVLNSISAFRTEIFWYFATLYVFSFVAGMGIHSFAASFRIDRDVPLLRYNDWYYLFQGDLDDFKRQHYATEAGVYLGCVVEVGGESFVYRGWLQHYAVDKDGKLTQLTLLDAARRKLQSDDLEGMTEERDPADKRYYKMRGDVLVLGQSVVNVTVTYVTLQEIPRTATAPLLPTGLESLKPGSLSEDPRGH